MDLWLMLASEESNFIRTSSSTARTLQSVSLLNSRVRVSTNRCLRVVAPGFVSTVPGCCHPDGVEPPPFTRPQGFAPLRSPLRVSSVATRNPPDAPMGFGPNISARRYRTPRTSPRRQGSEEPRSACTGTARSPPRKAAMNRAHTRRVTAGRRHRSVVGWQSMVTWLFGSAPPEGGTSPNGAWHVVVRR